VAILGSLTILGNRHKGITRNLFVVVLLLAAYKFAYDMLGVLGLDLLQIIAFFAGTLIWYATAPLLYTYFRSLQTHEFELNRSLLKHFAIPALLLVAGGIFFIFLGEQRFLEVLNHRFEEDRSFERSISKIGLFLIGTPLLSAQWLLYFKYLKDTIAGQKSYYGKFYGSYEQRNEILMNRIFYSFFAVFAASFLVQFFQVNQPVYIILINIILGLLIWLVMVAGREQIDMKNYRMYKLSSHEEEIKNNKQVNEL
jgi:hypothetical protein